MPNTAERIDRDLHRLLRQLRIAESRGDLDLARVLRGLLDEQLDRRLDAARNIQRAMIHSDARWTRVEP